MHTSETKEQETKCCERWYGKVTLLTRENLIQLIATSVWLEFIFYTINFKINQSSYLIQIVYFIIVLHVPTMFFPFWKINFSANLRSKWHHCFFFWWGVRGWVGGGRGGKNVHKMYEGRGGLLETYESVQGREGVKKCQIWAYILIEWPPVKPIYYSINETS